LVYACDHEPHTLHPVTANPGELPIHHEDQRHVRFLAGADLVIHDSQYTLDDFPAKAGWGHTPMERAVDYASAAGARRLALSHHDPRHDDDTVDAIAQRAAQRAAQAPYSPDVFAAAEGQCLELPQGSLSDRSLEPRPSALLSSEPPQAATVLVVEDDPDMLELIRVHLRQEQVRILCATDGEAALHLAREERPSLMLLDLNIPVRDGFEVCRILRAGGEEWLRDLPILILTGSRLGEEAVTEAFLAGATDFLVKPIKPSLLRSTVRGWIQRQRRG
jgi:CheY-like chemotaxis protein